MIQELDAFCISGTELLSRADIGEKYSRIKELLDSNSLSSSQIEKALGESVSPRVMKKLIHVGTNPEEELDRIGKRKGPAAIAAIILGEFYGMRAETILAAVKKTKAAKIPAGLPAEAITDLLFWRLPHLKLKRDKRLPLVKLQQEKFLKLNQPKNGDYSKWQMLWSDTLLQSLGVSET